MRYLYLIFPLLAFVQIAIAGNKRYNLFPILPSIGLSREMQDKINNEVCKIDLDFKHEYETGDTCFVKAEAWTLGKVGNKKYLYFKGPSYFSDGRCKCGVYIKSDIDTIIWHSEGFVSHLCNDVNRKKRKDVLNVINNLLKIELYTNVELYKISIKKEDIGENVTSIIEWPIHELPFLLLDKKIDISFTADITNQFLDKIALWQKHCYNAIFQYKILKLSEHVNWGLYFIELNNDSKFGYGFMFRNKESFRG